MTCKEVPTGNGSSRVENSTDDNEPDDYGRGVVMGYADARRGQKYNSTIHLMSPDFRNGYLTGYIDYQDAAMRFHRDDAGMVD